MYKKRAIEDIIIESGDTFKAVLVTGARQVGKSTTLIELYDSHPYFTFDDPVLLDETLREPGLFFRNHETPLVLDEVQYISKLFPYIKMICDSSNDRGLVMMTGSQQYHLMKNVSESLAGRIAILEMSGLSLRELNDDSFNLPFVPTKEYIQQRKKTAMMNDNIWRYIHRGSFPALLDSQVDWQMFYSSYVQTYIERDVNDLSNIKDKHKFTNFLSVAASRTGQMLNYSSMADQLDVSSSTVKEWVSILEASGLVYIMQPFSNSALKRTIKTPKLYFRDTGLVCYLTKYPTPEIAMNNAMAGALFETFVVSEIIKSYANLGIDYRMNITYYRGKDKIRKQRNKEKSRKESEIDILIEENGIIYPIEIKMSANPKLDMTNAFDVIDRIPNKERGTGAIICMYDKPMWLSDNVVSLPVEYI